MDLNSLVYGIFFILAVSFVTSSVNATSLANIATQQTGSSEQMVSWTGLKSSNLAVTADEEEAQKVVILPPREDRQLFTGHVTFDSSRPVQAIVWNVVHLSNETSALLTGADDLINIGEFQVALSEIGDVSESGSFSFVGNAVELIAPTDEPFIASYALTANIKPYEVVTDLKSLNESQDLNSVTEE